MRIGCGLSFVRQDRVLLPVGRVHRQNDVGFSPSNYWSYCRDGKIRYLFFVAFVMKQLIKLCVVHTGIGVTISARSPPQPQWKELRLCILTRIE